jgi:hypothetical protein
MEVPVPTDTVVVLAGVLAAFSFFAVVLLYVDTTSREK